MNDKYYGIDINAKVTALMVRDAIVDCFWNAHCKDTGIDESEKVANRSYCKSIVEKAFVETGGDYSNPTKDTILKTLRYLADFSKGFRDPSLITKHYNDIMFLVEKL
jgi:hypothetical protein